MALFLVWHTAAPVHWASTGRESFCQSHPVSPICSKQSDTETDKQVCSWDYSDPGTQNISHSMLIKLSVWCSSGGAVVYRCIFIIIQSHSYKNYVKLHTLTWLYVCIQYVVNWSIVLLYVRVQVSQLSALSFLWQFQCLFQTFSTDSTDFKDICHIQTKSLHLKPGASVCGIRKQQQQTLVQS